MKGTMIQFSILISLCLHQVSSYWLVIIANHGIGCNNDRQYRELINKDLSCPFDDKYIKEEHIVLLLEKGPLTL